MRAVEVAERSDGVVRHNGGKEGGACVCVLEENLI